MKWFCICLETPDEQLTDARPSLIYVEAWDFGTAATKGREYVKKAQETGDLSKTIEVSIIRLADPIIRDFLPHTKEA